jgi:hypothetical protein
MSERAPGWAAPDAFTIPINPIRTTQVGTLRGFGGSVRSSLGYLLVDEEVIPCDNAATVEALATAYGVVLHPDGSVNQDAFVGRRVVYTTLSIGPNRLLAGFTPIEDYEGPALPPEGFVESSGD